MRDDPDLRRTALAAGGVMVVAGLVLAIVSGDALIAVFAALALVGLVVRSRL